MREIISEYSFDDLCAPYQPRRDPRQEIVQELKRLLERDLEPLGIQLIGGGMANLMPVDKKLVQQRINTWQAEWSRQIKAEAGKGEADYIRLVESARAQAQAEMIRTISEGFDRAGSEARDIPPEVIAMRFIEAMEKMIQSPAVQQAVPHLSLEAVEHMRHSLESKGH